MDKELKDLLDVGKDLFTSLDDEYFYTAIDAQAEMLFGMLKSYRGAGFTRDEAMQLVVKIGAEIKAVI